MQLKRKLLYSVLALSSVALFACGDDNDGTSVLRYVFSSRFTSGSSVSTSGQVARQVLIADLNTEIAKGLDIKIINAPTTVDTQAEALAILNQYYADGTDVLGATPITLKTTPATKQTSYTDISVGKKLQNKIAGNDSVTDHKDWDAPRSFVGFTAASPDDLIQTWLGAIAANTATKAAGTNRPDPIDNTKSLTVFQSNDGLDLKQLVQKFLLGAITFSQGTDDYLDDATPNKGLLAANVQDGTKAHTKLEHQFDEAFGYFGAARNYNDYTDNEIRGKSGRDAFKSGYNDTNGDGAIDLLSEFNFGNSTNAAKRDAGSTTGTDFTKSIFDAFVTGRAIITNASDPLTADEMTALKAQRDIIVANWEKAIAATVVHYINEVVNDDMAVFGQAGYSYSNHIKHWGELKGFSLGFQFNPRSALSDAKFAEFHTKVGERPVLPNDAAGVATPQATIDSYKTSLLAARDILQTAYNFDATDVAGW